MQEIAGKLRVEEARWAEEHAITMVSALTVCAVEPGDIGQRNAGQIYLNSVETVERKATPKTSAD